MASELVLAAKINLPRGRDVAFVLDWKAHTDQTIDNSISDLVDVQGGRIVALETIPGQNGDLATDLPTNLYDLKIDDEYGCDIAAGALANRSGTVGERVNPSVGIPVWAPLTLTGAACGDSKQGRLIVVISKA